MDETIETAIQMSAAMKKKLRGLGHHLEPVVFVGKEGLSDAVTMATNAALKSHELVKIKLGQNCPVGREEAAQTIAQLTEATIIQIIGKIILLYRPNPQLPENKSISMRIRA